MHIMRIFTFSRVVFAASGWIHYYECSLLESLRTPGRRVYEMRTEHHDFIHPHLIEVSHHHHHHLPSRNNSSHPIGLRYDTTARVFSARNGMPEPDYLAMESKDSLPRKMEWLQSISSLQHIFGKSPYLPDIAEQLTLCCGIWRCGSFRRNERTKCVLLC